jgi:hypothetical protein
MIDAALLAEADALATKRGQTRRVFVERALETAVRGGPVPPRVVRERDAAARERKAQR